MAIARTLSDTSTTEIAKHYEGNDLLKHFPVPRMTIHDVDINLKFAVDTVADASSRALSETIKKNILDQINGYIRSLPETDFFEGLFQQDGLMTGWDKMFSSLMDEIEQVFPETTLVEPEKLAAAIGTVVELFIYRCLLQEQSSGLLDNWWKKIHKTKTVDDQADFLNIKQHVAGKVEQIIATTCNLTHPASETTSSAMNILVEASELESIPLEKIHSIKIRLSSADRQLVNIENEGRTILSPM